MSNEAQEVALRTIARELLARGGDPAKALQDYVDHPLNEGLLTLRATVVDTSTLKGAAHGFVRHGNMDGLSEATRKRISDQARVTLAMLASEGLEVTWEL